MPSPFPGMDPYLEAAYVFPDLHSALAGTLYRWLNRHLPRPYYARMELRPEVGVVEDEGYVRHIIPDVSVVKPAHSNGGVALAEPAVATESESFEVTVANELYEHPMIEVRDPTQGHELVTLIEIASPANKGTGADRDAYLKKQAEVLASSANLVEIDLLRGGKRLFARPELDAVIAQRSQRTDYVIAINRAWKRDVFQVFPIVVTERLPTIPLPLRKAQPELLMNLQELFAQTYDDGPYRRGAVAYEKPPNPLLPPELTAWAEECLRKAGLLPVQGGT